MKKEKRKSHSYKCYGVYYKNAMKRASREKFPLSKLIEDIVKAYSLGGGIKYYGIAEFNKLQSFREVSNIFEAKDTDRIKENVIEPMAIPALKEKNAI
jgi:hypothetical protein